MHALGVPTTRALSLVIIKNFNPKLKFILNNLNIININIFINLLYFYKY
jgi:hypothetical protein